MKFSQLCVWARAKYLWQSSVERKKKSEIGTQKHKEFKVLWTEIQSIFQNSYRMSTSTRLNCFGIEILEYNAFFIITIYYVVAAAVDYIFRVLFCYFKWKKLLWANFIFDLKCIFNGLKWRFELTRWKKREQSVCLWNLIFSIL